ncbi:unnamed protein product, partial [Laminaria digitata]
QQIQGYQEETEFRVCVTAVALLRFLCEHLHRLPLGVMTRVLDTHDVLLGLVILVENPPWTRRTDKGTWQKFVDLEWKNVPATDLLKVTKTEGQIWLAMYHLMCEEECRKRYHFNSMRKGNILRARKYLNDVLLDQLPVLAGVQRYMDELTIMEVPEPPSMGTTGSLLMEQIPKMRQDLTRGHDWDEVADKAVLDVFSVYDDASDPDVKSVGALFAGGEQEEWGSDEPLPPPPLPVPPPSAAAAAATGAAAAATTLGDRKGRREGGEQQRVGGGGGGKEERKEAPASSVHA